MSQCSYPISPYHAELSYQDLRVMMQVVRLLNKLSENSTYQTLLKETLPVTAQINNGHHAVMMGYDFHLSETGPKLIEVNTNAGGLWLAYLCHQSDAQSFSTKLTQKLLQTFLTEYAGFSQNPTAHPQFIVILDDQPQTQFLYSEMQIFAQLFQQAGIECEIIAPEDLTAKNAGLYFNNKRIDLIYNRHCDFYLESAQMALVREAWVKRQLCLTPNPFIYGLLADKRRMVSWSDLNFLSQLGLSNPEIELLKKTIPRTFLLSALTQEQAWQTRKQWVFKPVSSHGSRGVYVGDKLTKGKLAELEPDNTLIQQRIAPSVTQIPPDLSFKTDYRLFAYRQQILAVSARLYQGQVTNLRTENGGFAKVQFVK
jgi:hypothetical protein